MIPLLILRPEPGASQTARAAEALGLTAIVRPLFVITPVEWDAPDPARFDALLLTSANAIRHGGVCIARYCALPVFAVGASTAAAARAARFAKVTTGSGDAAATLRALGGAGYSRPLHLAGEDRTSYPPLAYAVETRTVYAARETAVAIPNRRHVALLHSVRAADCFARICPARDAIDIVAISAVVGAAAGAGWRSIHCATTPDDQAMLELAARLCDGPAKTSGPP